MQQMNVPEDCKVSINFDDESLHPAVKTLQPLLFTDGNGFCCLLGPDFTAGVMGCGATADAAVKNWEANLHKRISNPGKEDVVATFILDKLNASVNDVG